MFVVWGHRVIRRSQVKARKRKSINHVVILSGCPPKPWRRRNRTFGQQGFVQFLPMFLLFFLVATTFVIVARIQRERTGELRQFAGCQDQYSCGPTTSPAPPPPPPAGGGGGCGGFKEGVVALGGEAYDAAGGRQARRRCEYDPALGYSVWKQCPDCPLTIIPGDSVDTKKYQDELAAYQSQQSIYLTCLVGGGSDSECMGKVNASIAQSGGTNYLLTREGNAWARDEARKDLEKQAKMQEYVSLQDDLNACIEHNQRRITYYHSSQECEGFESQLSAARNALLALGFTSAQIQAQTKSAIISQQATNAVLAYLAAQEAYQSCVTASGVSKCGDLKKNVETLQGKAQGALEQAGLDSATDQQQYIHAIYVSQVAEEYMQKEAAFAACAAQRGGSGRAGECLREFTDLQKVISESRGLSAGEIQDIREGGIQSYNIYKALYKTDEQLSNMLCSGKTPCDVDKELAAYIKKQNPSFTTKQVSQSVQDRRSQITQQENNFQTYRDYIAASTSDAELAKQCPPCLAHRKRKEEFLAQKRNELTPEYRELADTEIIKATQTIVDAHPVSSYAQLYQDWKEEKLSLLRGQKGRSGDKRRFAMASTSEDELRKAFDTANKQALAAMAPIWDAQGTYDLNYAKWQRGEISPLVVQQQYIEQTKGWDLAIPTFPFQIVLPILGPAGKVLWDAFGWEDPGKISLDISPKKWAYDTITWTNVTLKDVIPSRPDWMVRNQTEGTLALLADTPVAKQEYIEANRGSPKARQWMEEHDTNNPQDYIRHQLEGYYKNQGYFEKQGLSQDTDAGQIYFDKILRGEVDIDQEISRRGLDKTSTQLVGTAFFGVMKVLDTGLKIVTFGNENSFQQLVMPNLTSAQQHSVADIAIDALSSDALNAREQQALTDPEERKAFDEWRTEQPKGEDTSFRAYLKDAYADALDITDLGQIGNYKVEGAKELFTRDPNWLTRGVLQCTIGAD